MTTTLQEKKKRGRPRKKKTVSPQPPTNGGMKDRYYDPFEFLEFMQQGFKEPIEDYVYRVERELRLPHRSAWYVGSEFSKRTPRQGMDIMARYFEFTNTAARTMEVTASLIYYCESRGIPFSLRPPEQPIIEEQEEPLNE